MTRTIDFFIDRTHHLFADGVTIGRFATEAAAADMAVRFAQAAEALYCIHYPR